MSEIEGPGSGGMSVVRVRKGLRRSTCMKEVLIMRYVWIERGGGSFAVVIPCGDALSRNEASEYRIEY